MNVTKHGLSLNTEKCELCLLGPTTSTQYNSILTQFRKICPTIKIKTKEELLILGSPIGELCRKEFLNEKIKELVDGTYDDALKRWFDLGKIVHGTYDDGTYDDALKRWFDLGKIEMAPENEIQKNWTESIFDSEIADLILRLEPTDVKRFNAFQDRFGSQWLNVIPCKTLRLKLSNQQLRIAIGLRLGSKIF